MKMNPKIGSKRERIKSCILKGRTTILLYSNEIKPARVETINFNCNCGIKCATLFSEEQNYKAPQFCNELKCF
jgi:hypothetical protein